MERPARPLGSLILLALFSVVYVTLCVGSYRGKSATWDEPQHLTAGYTALRLADYRIDQEHPPLLRLWAALPLVVTPDVKLETGRESWGTDQWDFSHEFLYLDNDADLLLNRARFMVALLGVALGVLLFLWAHELYGFPAAAAVLLLYTLEPNLQAHAGLVTTDFAVTFLIFGAVFCLRRLCVEARPGNLAGLVLFFAAAQVTKFSAVVLVPIVALPLLHRGFVGRPWPHRLPLLGPFGSRRTRLGFAVGVLALLAIAAFAVVWIAYGLRFAATPAASGKYVAEIAKESRVNSTPQPVLAAARWLQAHRVLPEAYAQGFVLSQGKGQKRSAFLNGTVSSSGWWWYFPTAFALKTPLTVQVLFFAAAVFAFASRGGRKEAAFTFLPIALFLVAAMTSKLNIGVRHILPIYPFALLLAGGAIAALLRGRFRATCVALALLLGIEFWMVYPDTIAAFNLAVGGPARGHQYLADSNLDWGQDLKGLKRWLDEHRVSHVNLSYFGAADPEYYRINCTFLPGSPYFARHRVGAPVLPGYVAVSVTNLQGVYFKPEGRAYYRPLLLRKPLAIIGRSIWIYDVAERWW
jgi:hypothetical protein